MKSLWRTLSPAVLVALLVACDSPAATAVAEADDPTVAETVPVASQSLLLFDETVEVSALVIVGQGFVTPCSNWTAQGSYFTAWSTDSIRTSKWEDLTQACIGGGQAHTRGTIDVWGTYAASTKHLSHQAAGIPHKSSFDNLIVGAVLRIEWFPDIGSGSNCTFGHWERVPSGLYEYSNPVYHVAGDGSEFYRAYVECDS